MENQGNPMLKHSMNYGLIMGVGLVILSLLVYLVGVVRPPFWVSLINYAIMIGVIVYGTKKYRDEVLGGGITYGQALGFGVMISLFASIIFAFYMLLNTKVIDPGFVDKMLELTEEELLNKGMPDEQIEAALSMSKKFMSPMFMTISTLFGTVFIGTLFSLITSIFLKKEKSPFEEEKVIE